jgi:fermentation-respiration switch protein FrsA (DUF1100 family)
MGKMTSAIAHCLHLIVWIGSTSLGAGCGIENRMIFHPSRPIEQTPKQAGLAFDDLYFTARDGVRLNGWFIPHPQARATLVWFHGNAGNIGHRVENIKLLHDRVPVNIFIFDYRGYGRSEGTPDESGTYRDGEAALSLMREKFGAAGAETIVLFGRSLGAAVATEMATRFPVQALILESPFVSIAAMTRLYFPLLPVGPFLRTRYDVEETIRKVTIPVLVLHGEQDSIVPLEQGKLVFAAAPGPKQFYVISGADHNDTYVVGGEAYYDRMKRFIEETRSEKAARR